ncbi:MAG: tetratricopeptide repeat protein [Waddliaceae bacterium]
MTNPTNSAHLSGHRTAVYHQVQHDEDEEKTFDPLPDTPSGSAVPARPIAPHEPLSQERLDRIARVFSLSLPATEAGCFEALFSACKEKKWHQIQNIETECDAIVNAQGRSLLLEAFEQGEMELAENFFTRRIALHIPDREGNFATHYAIKSGFSHLIPWDQYDFDGHNRQDQTPSHLAAEKGDAQLIANLIANGARIDAGARLALGDVLFEGVTPLHIAIIYGNHQCIDVLLNHVIKCADPGITLPQIGNLLHIAIHFRRKYVLRHLLTTHFKRTKPLLNAPNGEGRTPAMEAAFQGDGESLAFLKEKGASLDACDQKGRTAFHWAAIGRQRITINLLFYYGCDLRAEDLDNNRPFDLMRGFRDSASQSIANHLKNLSSQKERLQHVPSLYAIYPPENLVFKGGGPKGIAYVGAMRALEKENALRDLIRVAGTSAGAINSAFIACGYNAEELEIVLRETDLTRFLDHPLTKKRIKEALENAKFSQAIGGIYSIYQTVKGAVKNPLSLVSKAFKKLWKTTGLCKGEEFRKWIEGHIQKKTYIEHCTFGELASLIEQGKPFKHLHIFTTRISSTQLQHINSEDPQWKDIIISDAVRASMSIPGVFDPHVLHCKREGRRLPAKDLGIHVDGGLIRNFPIEAFDKRKYHPYNPQNGGEFHTINTRTLGLSLYSPQDQQPVLDKEVETVGDLLRGILSIYFQAEEILQEQTYDNQFRTILIDNKGVGTTEFHLTQEKQKALITSGHHAVGRFYSEQNKLSASKENSMVIARIAHQAGYGTNIEVIPADFIERTSYLKKLSQRFFQEDFSLIQVVLWGFSGRGKSSIAIDFANRNLEKFSLVWKIDCEKELEMRRSYLYLADALGIRCKQDTPLEQIQQGVHYFLESRTEEKPYLLIFDNVEKVPTLPKRRGCLLITSREKGIWRARDCIEIEPFTREEAEHFLASVLGEDHQETFSIISKELGYHPATLAQTANYIATTPGMKPETFLTLLKTETRKAFELARPDDRYPVSTIASWKIMQDSLEQSHPEALRWLQCCAHFSPDAIPIRWLSIWLQENNDQKPSIKSGEILRVLTEKGLIRYDQQQQTLSLHRLRQHLCRISISEDNRQEVLAGALQLLHEIAANFDFDTYSNWTVIPDWVPHVEALLSLDLIPCKKKADLFFRVGGYLSGLGRYGEALKQHEEGLAIRKKVFGDEHPDVATSLSGIGNCLFRLGRYGEALKQCEEALAIRKKVFGDEHPDVAMSLNGIGNCLSGLGRHGEALKQYEEALAIRKKVFGDEHPHVATSLSGIGFCLSGMGRHQEALDNYKQAFIIVCCHFKHEHPNIILYLKSIVVCLRNLGRNDITKATKEELLPLCIQILGENHECTRSLSNVTNIKGGRCVIQ